MKALISSIEPRESGYRVAQTTQDENTFDVAEGLFWVDCANDVVADQFWYDPLDKTLKAVPEPVQTQQAQPISQGAQTL